MEVTNDVRLQQLYTNPTDENQNSQNVVQQSSETSSSNSVSSQQTQETSGVDDAQESSSYSVEVDSEAKRSNLSTQLEDTISQIAHNQVTLSQLNEQSELLNTIEDLATQIVESQTPVVTADEVQPQIEEAISQYNELAKSLSERFKESQEDTNSKDYFDGILGAKPLSPADILKAVEQQREIVQEREQVVQTQTQELEQQALETIGNERQESAQNSPFEPSDFASSNDLSSVSGSVIASQANAQPRNSPRLLS